MTREIEARLKLSAVDRTGPALDSAARKLKEFDRKAASVDRASAALAQRRRVEDRAAAIAARTHQIQMAGAVAAGARVVAPYLGAAAMTKSVFDFAKFDRQLSNIGITAGASREEMDAAGVAVRKLASEAATPIESVVGGLDTLVAAGRKLPDAMAFLPAVTRAALATNSAVDDIAKTADAMGRSFKISAGEMQTAFDVVAYLGNEGAFETKDQARYLPSIAPLAATRGLTGIEGLKHVGAALQTIQKNAGTTEEAAASMTDVLGKIDSDETRKRMSKEFGIDLPKALEKARKAGKNTFDAFLDITELAIKGDYEKINRIFADKEARRGLTALMMFRNEYKELIAQSANAAGTIDTGVKRKVNDAQAAVDRLGNAFKATAVAAGSLADAVGVTTMLEAVAEKAAAGASNLSRLTGEIKTLGAVGGIKKWFDDNEKTPGTAAYEDRRLREGLADFDSRAAAKKRHRDDLAAAADIAAAQRAVEVAQAAPKVGAFGYRSQLSDHALAQAEERLKRAKAAAGRLYPVEDYGATPGIPVDELGPLSRSGRPQPRPPQYGEVGGHMPMPRTRPDPLAIEVMLDDASISAADSELQRQRARLQQSLDAQPLTLRIRTEAARLPPLDTGRSITGNTQAGGP